MIWNREDSLFLMLVFGTTAAVVLLLQTEAINRELTLLLFLAILVPASAKPMLETYLRNTYSKTFAKDLTDYWANATERLWKANQKHLLHYNLNIPDGYIPQEQAELPEIGLSIHTIKSEDTIAYGIEYSDHKYPEKTIIYNTKQQKIIAILPLSFDQTITFLKNNKAYFTKESTQLWIPQTIKELSFGKPVKG